jgi:hypothetical protein
MHPIHNVPDWDNAETSVDYPSLVAFLRRVKETGELHAGHKTHDSLRMRSCVTLSDEAVARWGELFAEKVRARERERGERIVWGLLDGFLVYWCKVSAASCAVYNLLTGLMQDVVRELDARLFLRVPRAVLQQRRKDWGAALITGEKILFSHRSGIRELKLFLRKPTDPFTVTIGTTAWHYFRIHRFTLRKSRCPRTWTLTDTYFRMETWSTGS